MIPGAPGQLDVGSVVLSPPGSPRPPTPVQAAALLTFENTTFFSSGNKKGAEPPFLTSDCPQHGRGRGTVRKAELGARGARCQAAPPRERGWAEEQVPAAPCRPGCDSCSALTPRPRPCRLRSRFRPLAGSQPLAPGARPVPGPPSSPALRAPHRPAPDAVCVWRGGRRASHQARAGPRFCDRFQRPSRPAPPKGAGPLWKKRNLS